MISLPEKKHHLFKHGMSTTPEYRSWASMISRCYRPKNVSYPNYGGRGVQVCSRWRESFLNFFEDMGQRPPGHSLDRINGNGDYEPGNCRWATRSQQRRNSRDSLLLDGVPLIEVAESAGISRESLVKRLRAGWETEDALSRPLHTNGSILTKEQVRSIREAAFAGSDQYQLADKHGVSRRCVRDLLTGRTFKNVGGPLCVFVSRGPHTRMEWKGKK